MTRKETEAALIKLGEAMQAIVHAYKGNANHMSIDCIDGRIHVRACEWDGEKADYVEENILCGSRFEDGTLYIGGEYV